MDCPLVETADCGIAGNHDGWQIHTEQAAEQVDYIKPSNPALQMKVHDHGIGSEFHACHLGQSIGKSCSRDNQTVKILQCPCKSLTHRTVVIDYQNMTLRSDTLCRRRRWNNRRIGSLNGE